MDRPKTLLQLAGAEPAPAGLSQAVLLLIDCQREYVDGALPLAGIGAALAEIEALCRRARAAATPVVHVRHRGRRGGAFDLDQPRGALAAPLQRAADEPEVLKSLPNAFAGTDLARLLEATGRRRLIVGGFMTHMCVSSTVRAALDLGYDCTVVAAATATRDLPAPDGGVVGAAELQRASLAALADRFAVVAADAEAIPE